jgi:hypothetical protein
LKTTTTTPNRITIFIMNLWGNRVGQLLIIAVALFFFSCEEENNLLGYKNPTSKFQSYTVEIPIESSIILLDSVKSSNGIFTNETDRILTGEFVDPDLGKVTSTAISQFFSYSAEQIKDGATLDSAKLAFPYDGYYYGSNAETDIVFKAFRLNTRLDYLQRRTYISRTEVELGEEVGSVSTFIMPDSLGVSGPATKPDASFDTLFIDLSQSFRDELWKVVTDYKQDVNNVFVSLEKFTDQFKGIAIQTESDKNIAIGLRSFASQMILYYHAPNDEGEDVKYTVRFKTRENVNGTLSHLVTYSRMVADRSGSVLAGLDGFMNEFDPGDHRYVQAGTGVVTKLNFDKFYEFVDTVNTNVIINEAELSIGGIVANPEGENLPSGFTVRMLKPDQYQDWTQWHFYPRFQVDSLKLARFAGYMVRDVQTVTQSGVAPPMVDNTYVATIADDVQGKVLLRYSSSRNAYLGYPTLYFQQAMLSDNRDFREFTNAMIYPLIDNELTSAQEYDGTGASKAINKVAFPASQIKLTIKYTKPIIDK